MRKSFLILLLVLVQFAASAQNLSEQKERRQKAEKEIEFINSQLKTISSKQKASTEQQTETAEIILDWLNRHFAEGGTNEQ